MTPGQFLATCCITKARSAWSDDTIDKSNGSAGASTSTVHVGGGQSQLRLVQSLHAACSQRVAALLLAHAVSTYGTPPEDEAGTNMARPCTERCTHHAPSGSAVGGWRAVSQAGGGG